ncbi:MAG TPA: FAD-dependent oxidoreductase [Candidatus Baltobacteraceae bacterium]|jgi:pyruvate/2-oxoglutarate dehydrogenase complex dihydrolipoamide dehydrogenase (E3) component|nr:FAD-dependent oxidoreductase [Candidatus Baltobacteraceae bacterium]
MNDREFDLVVVGAGSGGYAAARTARDAGARVALVDQGPLGGLCILRGCMPSKALLASSDAANDAREMGSLGVKIAGVSVDMPFIAARKRALVKDFADYRIEGIETFPLFMGRAQFLSPSQVQVGADVTLTAKKFIIGTGSSVAAAHVPGLIDAGYLDTDSVLEIERIPESVIVLGGGYTACELGQFLARMGSRVTMVIRSGHLLTEQDDDIGDALTAYYRAEGIDVIAHASLSRVDVCDGKKIVAMHAGNEHRELAADEIFYALGRTPNIEGLGLERANVVYHPMTGIDVDLTLRTSNPDIFAIGDVTGEFPLVHVAIYQGEIAARNAVTAASEEADYRVVTAHTVFSDPQVAVVGANEKRLNRDGVRYVRGRYDFAEHGKAMCLNKTKGFVKMLADSADGTILGAAVIGPQASELIHEVIVAMTYFSTVEQFMRIPHLHPTLSEIWTYPAEECAAQIGMKAPVDQQIEVATSGTAG